MINDLAEGTLVFKYVTFSLNMNSLLVL